tara:strand:+ start:1669 stop:2220 length:552 start_codon:yes stop_codon:yes gene_type:complete
MYALEIDTLFIEIPRTGMRSLERALRGVSSVSHVGHYTVQRFLDCVKNPPENYVAIIRDPVDRLLSAINFSCLEERHVDRAFEKVLKEGYSTEIIAPTCFEELGYVYAPQTAYLDVDVDYKFHSFAAMKGFYQCWLPSKTPFHENKSNKWFSLDQLQQHRLFEDIMQVYKKDVGLYKSLNPTP